MLYFPLLDVVVLDYAPIIEHRLVPIGQAIVDPPYREGGYSRASEAVYRLLLARAVDMQMRRDAVR